MTCGEILEELEREMPLSLAMDWDNPGLLIGDPDGKVKKAVIALDATTEAVNLAIREKADLILTHHPVIFSPLKKVVSGDIVGRRIIRMVEHHISCIAMHTNYDVAPGCMADIAAGMLGITGVPLEETGLIGDRKIGIGKTGNLPQEMTLEELTRMVREKFGLPFVTVFGKNVIRDGISRISVCPGSGKGMYHLAREQGSQVLITGDISHHEGLDAAEDGIAVIDAGHYGLEHIFINDMEKRIAGMTEGIETVRMAVSFPEEVM